VRIARATSFFSFFSPSYPPRPLFVRNEDYASLRCTRCNINREAQRFDGVIAPKAGIGRGSYIVPRGNVRFYPRISRSPADAGDSLFFLRLLVISLAQQKRHILPGWSAGRSSAEDNRRLSTTVASSDRAAPRVRAALRACAPHYRAIMREARARVTARDGQSSYRRPTCIGKRSSRRCSWENGRSFGRP